MGLKYFLYFLAIPENKIKNIFRHQTLRHVEKTIRKTNIKSVFIASDNQEGDSMLRASLNGMGCHVISNPMKQYLEHGKRKTSTEDAIIDLYLLASCQYIVPNLPSSTFALVASLLFNSKVVVSKSTHKWTKLLKG